MLRARTGNQDPIFDQHLKGGAVQREIVGFAGGLIFATLDQRRRVEDHDVEALTLLAKFAKRC